MMIAALNLDLLIFYVVYVLLVSIVPSREGEPESCPASGWRPRRTAAPSLWAWRWDGGSEPRHPDTEQSSAAAAADAPRGRDKVITDAKDSASTSTYFGCWLPLWSLCGGRACCWCTGRFCQDSMSSWRHNLHQVLEEIPPRRSGWKKKVQVGGGTWKKSN